MFRKLSSCRRYAHPGRKMIEKHHISSRTCAGLAILAVCLLAARPLRAQIITTVVGNGIGGYSGDGGPATAAELCWPRGAALDASGNLFFADSENNVVRRVDAATGIITTVAGNGYLACSWEGGGYSGDGGPATLAEMYNPNSVAFDAGGNFYIADANNNRVRKVDASTGIISTYAGGGNCGSTYCGDGGPATNAELDWPESVAVDGSGNIYIGDAENNVVRRIDGATGIISTVAGNGYDAGTGGSGGYSGDGGPATLAELANPWCIALDSSGNIYIVDSTNQRVREVSAATGIINTVAGNGFQGYSGDGGPATETKLYDPGDVALDASGNLYLSDTWNFRVREVDAFSGIITTIAGTGECVHSGDGGPATEAGLCLPYGLAFDAAGDLYIGESGSICSSGSEDIRLVTGLAAIHATQTAVASSVASLTYGQAVTFNTTITPVPAQSNPITGQVRFQDGANVLGTETVTSSGTASLTTTMLAAGAHNICAVYSGDTYYVASSGCTSVTVSQAVLSVGADNTVMTPGSQVPPLAYTMSGFVNGDTQYSATTGQPALSTTATSSSPIGTYPITITQGTLAAANYSFQFGDGELIIIVPIAAAASPTVQQVASGSSAVYTVTISSQAGFSGAVSLTCAVAPAGGGCSFAQSTVTVPANGSAQTTMTVTTTTASAARFRPELHAARPRPGGPAVPFNLGGIAALLLAPWGRKKPRRRRWPTSVLLILALCLLAAGFVSCGGSSSATQQPGSTTYTITVTATSTAFTPAVSQSVSVGLVVN
jgi:hypothetical protein